MLTINCFLVTKKTVTLREARLEVKRVKLQELRDDEGRQVSWRHFYAGRKMNIHDVFVISTLGIVVLSLRHHIDGWLNTEMGKYMGSVINSVSLENVARGNFSEFQNTTVDNELARAEGHITLVTEKVNEQKKNIDSLQVQLDALDEARAKNSYILRGS